MQKPDYLMLYHNAPLLEGAENLYAKSNYMGHLIPPNMRQKLAFFHVVEDGDKVLVAVVLDKQKKDESELWGAIANSRPHRIFRARAAFFIAYTEEKAGQTTDMKDWTEHFLADLFANKDISDVHICARENAASAAVLVRKDGLLVKANSLSYGVAKAVAGVCHTISNNATEQTVRLDRHDDYVMTINEMELRVTQVAVVGGDGSFDLMFRRVGTRSSGGGENWTFKAMGYTDGQVTAINAMLSARAGFTLVAGPTGSGKSTALDVALRVIRDQHEHRLKIYSLADPVENLVFGVSQINVADGDWANALRHLLRADPDVVSVGELRDSATLAQVAQFALAGRRVLSTSHASSCGAMLHRLQKLGLTPEDLANGDLMTGIICQMLLPLTCPDCTGRRAYSPDEQALLTRHGLAECMVKQVGDGTADDGRCATCAGTGTNGQVVVAETMAWHGWQNQEFLAALGAGDINRAIAIYKNTFPENSLWANAKNLCRQGLVDPLMAFRKLGAP